MKSILDDSRIELSCPKCGRKFSERIGKLKLNPTLPCDSCGTQITIDASDLNSAMKKVDKQMADLQRTLGSLGKKR